MPNILIYLLVPTTLQQLINVFIIKKFLIAHVQLIYNLKRLKIKKNIILLKIVLHLDALFRIFILKIIILPVKLFVM
jgi:hypothetical protein